MPEGDTVWLAAARLHEALAGRVLTVSDFRVPRLATADLRGRTVHEAAARGKHLLIRVDGGLTVHTHLMMDGAWRIRPAGHPPRDHRIRLALGNERWLALGYSLGVVELLRTDEEDRAVGRLGPDLLGADWDPEEAVRRLCEWPERAVGEAVMDQSRLAGIGNVYKSELCFLRGVHPWRPVGDAGDLRALVDLAQRLLEANKRRHGHITTGDLRPGREHWVYGRAGRPCRRCGTRIERADQGPEARERVTFWCPRCQPAP
ncbi:endonuclease-8 [Thermomonospora echinospora]|uniref:DNA-(apurinic or apyrimidinic site) lyase n=1 Tax=Thermomonospora echinospora TaxID=1992 RepID=A0A1H6BL26_9ACTN|nr:DNA-formamidopyrimidine glycosylase family protein [Thermomonospora echinospora]SEG61373.1 endonuclease-8 [Thermomonospora echinospora]